MTRVRKPIDASHEIQQALTAALEAARASHATLVVLEKMVRFAKGTEDVTDSANKVSEGRKRKPTEEQTEAPKRRGRPSPDGGELYRKVEALLRSRPMTFREILDETGEQNPNRLKGAITTFQREGKVVVNLGTKGRAKWFITAGKSDALAQRPRAGR